MSLVDIPWPLTNNPGSAFNEGSGRLLNCYAFKDAGSPRWRPVPGLTPLTAVPTGEVRGFAKVAGNIIAVCGRFVVQIDRQGGVTPLEGQIPGDGPVTVAVNNAAPPSVVICSNNGLYQIVGTVVQPYNTGTGTSIFTPAALPPINSVTFLDGYFFFTNVRGVMYASNLNSTNVSALATATAEARPDNLLRGIVYGQQFLAFGTDTVEVYQDAGQVDFPLTRSTVIPIGLLSPWAIAGFEDGWGGPLIFVAQNGSVQLLNGYIPQRISSDDLEELIQKVPSVTDLRASVYTFGGNAIWSLSSPTWTWEYNVSTGYWHERRSYARDRWLGAKTFNAFGGWIAADASGGTLYTVDPAARTEDGQAMVWGLDGGPLKQFPIRIAVPAAYFDFVLGQAILDGDPQVLLSWSHDGGDTWAKPLMRSLGRRGQTRGRVQLNRIGLTTPAGVRFSFRISDPAYSSFDGARCEAVGRR